MSKYKESNHITYKEAIEEIAKIILDLNRKEGLPSLESTKEWPDNWPESACKFGDLANEKIFRLQNICKEIVEIYAGREGYVCETPLEIYQERLINQMYSFAAKYYHLENPDTNVGEGK